MLIGFIISKMEHVLAGTIGKRHCNNQGFSKIIFFHRKGNQATDVLAKQLAYLNGWAFAEKGLPEVVNSAIRDL